MDTRKWLSAIPELLQTPIVVLMEAEQEMVSCQNSFEAVEIAAQPFLSGLRPKDPKVSAFGSIVHYPERALPKASLVSIEIRLFCGDDRDA